MIKYLLVTHAYLAEGFRSASEMIMGKQERLLAFCAYLNENENVFEKIDDEVRDLSTEDTLIIITDLLGGSVNSAMMQYTKNKNIHLVTGANLLLIIQLLMIQTEDEMIKKFEKKLGKRIDEIDFPTFYFLFKNRKTDEKTAYPPDLFDIDAKQLQSDGSCCRI